MTSIQGHGHPCKKRTSEKSSPPPEFNYDKALVDPFVGRSTPLIAKYTKKNLQKIFKIVLKAQAPPYNGLYKKLLKARSPGIYCNKSHIESYNFYQKCEDYFATAKAKALNCILFIASFLHDHINFRWQ